MAEQNELKTFKFGMAEITIHRKVTHYERFLKHTEVLISICGDVQEFYLKNEVMDLVGYNTGENFFHNPPLERDVQAYDLIGRNKSYEMKWTNRLI